MSIEEWMSLEVSPEGCTAQEYRDGSIPWKVRSDLQWTPRMLRGKSEWIAEDILTRKFYRLGVEEKQILERLDGKVTVSELLRWFSKAFHPLHLATDQLYQLIHLSAQRGLLTPVRNTGEQRSNVSSTSIVSQLLSLPWWLISSKVSIGNPLRLLNVLTKFSGPLFSRGGIRFWSGVMVVASFVGISNVQEIGLRLPEALGTIQMASMIGLGMAFFCVKIFHELGHAIVATRHGVRCVDMGFLMMMGVFCPYADVTESWRLPNKWERIAIAAAGMYVEGIIASLATFLWVMAADGPIREIAFQFMIVCTASTLLFNINPLLRYDGYYILSDFLEIPNLKERADRCWKESLQRFFLGIAPQPKEWSRLESIVLAFWGALSFLYRQVLLWGLLALVVHLAFIWEVAWFGIVMALGMVSTLLGASAVAGGRRMVDRWRSNSLSRWRAGLSLASLFLFLLIGMLFPFPIRHHGLGQLKAKGQYPVYALESGFLRASDATSLKSRKVLQGEYLASLDNPILEETVLRAQEHREMLSHAMQAAQRATFLDSQEMDQLPTLASMLAIAEKQWEVRVESWNRLQMLAPKEGMWYGNDSVSMNFEERFSPWGRTTFGEAITLGSLIPQGTLLGWIESRKGWEIELPLPETKISEVFEGMRCRVRLLQRPYDVFEGTVTHVAVQSSHEFQTGSDPSGPFGSGVGRSESSTTGNWPEVGKNGDSGQSVQYVVAVSLDSQEDLELALSGGAAEVVLWGRAKCMAQRALEWSHRNLKVR